MMPLEIPRLRTLYDHATQLPETYKSERERMDQKRVLAGKRPKTVNEMRIQFSEFVKNIAVITKDKEFKFASEIDSSFLNKDHQDVVRVHLATGIAGAYLFGLNLITDEYPAEKIVKERSAMAKIICNLFKIEKLSDIDEHDLCKCLQSCHDMMDKFEKAYPHQALKWHATLDNQELRERIEAIFSPVLMFQP